MKYIHVSMVLAVLCICTREREYSGKSFHMAKKSTKTKKLENFSWDCAGNSSLYTQNEQRSRTLVIHFAKMVLFLETKCLYLSSFPSFQKLCFVSHIVEWMESVVPLNFALTALYIVPVNTKYLEQASSRIGNRFDPWKNCFSLLLLRSILSSNEILVLNFTRMIYARTFNLSTFISRRSWKVNYPFRRKEAFKNILRLMGQVSAAHKRS